MCSSKFFLPFARACSCCFQYSIYNSCSFIQYQPHEQLVDAYERKGVHNIISSTPSFFARLLFWCVIFFFYSVWQQQIRPASSFSSVYNLLLSESVLFRFTRCCINRDYHLIALLFLFRFGIFIFNTFIFLVFLLN